MSTIGLARWAERLDAPAGQRVSADFERAAVQRGLQRARLAADMGKWSLAAALLQSCLQTHPDRGECLSLYGYCLARLGRLDEARSVCRRAVDMQSYVAEHHAHLGFVYQLAGLAPRALHCYRAALRLDSTNETALHGIALLQVRSWRARLRRWWRDVARPRSRPHPA